MPFHFPYKYSLKSAASNEGKKLVLSNRPLLWIILSRLNYGNYAQRTHGNDKYMLVASGEKKIKRMLKRL